MKVVVEIRKKREEAIPCEILRRYGALGLLYIYPAKGKAEVALTYKNALRERGLFHGCTFEYREAAYTLAKEAGCDTFDGEILIPPKEEYIERLKEVARKYDLLPVIVEE